VRLALLVLVLAALGLVACGKRGSPSAPGPADQILHYSYPPPDPDAPNP